MSLSGHTEEELEVDSLINQGGKVFFVCYNNLISVSLYLSKFGLRRASAPWMPMMTIQHCHLEHPVLLQGEPLPAESPR
jgi:hypothetical protein